MTDNGVKIHVGDIYEDCAYHPILCLESSEEEVVGISLFDYSEPRSCSVEHCAPRKLDAIEVAGKLRNKELWLEAEMQFRATLDPAVYERPLALSDGAAPSAGGISES